MNFLKLVKNLQIFENLFLKKKRIFFLFDFSKILRKKFIFLLEIF